MRRLPWGSIHQGRSRKVSYNRLSRSRQRFNDFYIARTYISFKNNFITVMYIFIGTRLEPTKCLLAYYPDVVRIPSSSGRLLLHTVVDQDQPNLGCVRLIARYFIVTTTKLYVYIVLFNCFKTSSKVLSWCCFYFIQPIFKWFTFSNSYSKKCSDFYL